MAQFDLPLEELQNYRPERQEPADFEAFWSSTLTQARQFPLKARFEPVDFGLVTVETYDVTFNGFGGQSIKGWLNLPRQRSGPLPAIVEFIGYGGGRGFPTDWLLWSSAGYAHLVMDTRGQGSVWRNGDTPDQEESSNPQSPGFMTRGILSPHTYYYRRVITDGVRAVETALNHPAIDPQRIATSGGSQGGGLALIVAGLVPEIFVTMPDVPFLCHYRRATLITDAQPYNEISTFCKIHRDKIDTVFETLSYFDGINFAARCQSHGFFSVALMDEVCPPLTVFAVYNHYAGPKEIKIYPYNNHEGGENYQTLEKLRLFKNLTSIT